MISQIRINKSIISKSNYPFIIAEMSGNHKKSLKRALKIVDIAADSGADAIKLQTYTADSMTIKSNRDDFKIKEGLWNGYSLYELYEEASTPYEWHKELFNYAKEIDISIFSIISISSMQTKDFESKSSIIETPNDGDNTEKPLQSNPVTPNRVDINVLKSKLQEAEGREFRKNLFILTFLIVTLSVIGIYLSF